MFRPLLMAFFTANLAHGLSSVWVPAESTVYDFLELLEAAGCASPGIRSLRPLNYREIQEELFQMPEPLATSDDNLDEEKEPTCQASPWLLLEREVLKRQFFPNEARADLVMSYEDLLSHPLIEAAGPPLLPLRGGRRVFNGPNLYLEAQASAQAGKTYGIALGVTPVFVGAYENYHHGVGRFFLQEFYVKASYQQLELALGRFAVTLGPARHGSLLLSSAAMPRQMVRLSLAPHLTQRPLSILGAVGFDAWISDEGDSAFPEKSRLMGGSFALRPTRAWETTLAGMKRMVWEGSRSDPAGESAEKDKWTLVWQNSFWLWQSSVNAYAQILFDSQKMLAREDLSYLAGVFLPKVLGNGLRVEYVRTAASAYRNSVWRAGLTYEKGFVGHPIGPDAEAAYVDFHFPLLIGWRPILGAFYERRGISALLVTQTSESRLGTSFDIRRRFLATEAGVQGIFAYATNHLFSPGNDTNVAALQAFVRYQFL